MTPAKLCLLHRGSLRGGKRRPLIYFRVDMGNITKQKHNFVEIIEIKTKYAAIACLRCGVKDATEGTHHLL